MANRQQYLDYLRDNYLKPGHILYHAGINKIYEIFKKKLKRKDIEDFLIQNYSYTLHKNVRKNNINPTYKRFKRQQFQVRVIL